jgi:uncharacterized protein (TIRG00374 family)
VSRRGHFGHVAAIVAKVVLSAGLLAFLLHRVRWDQVTATLARTQGAWMAAALGLMLLSNVIGSWQWSRLLRVVDIRIPFWKVCAYYHVGLFFNNLLPANIGGDFFRVADAARYGTSRTAALSAVVMDRLVNTLALGGLALITTLPALDRFHLWMIYLALVGFSAVSVIMLWAVFHPGLLPALERLLSRLGIGRLSPHLEELSVHLAGYREKPRLFLLMFLVAVVTQVSRIGVHVLVARALGLQVPLVYFFLFVPLLAVVVSLPISLNGIGVREGAGILVFGLVGVGRAEAFSLQFTTYLVAVAVSMLGGIVFLARLPRRRAQSRETQRRNAG